MELEFRDTQLTDIDALFELRGRTRQNPLSREALAQLGITPESTYRALGWQPTAQRTANADEILELRSAPRM